MVHMGGPMHGGSGQVGHRRRTDAGLQYLRRDGPDCVGGPLPIDSQGERRLAVRWRRDGPRRGARIGGRRLTRRVTGRARASRRAWRRGRAWDAVVHDNARARTGFLLSASECLASFGCNPANLGRNPTSFAWKSCKLGVKSCKLLPKPQARIGKGKKIINQV